MANDWLLKEYKDPVFVLQYSPSLRGHPSTRAPHRTGSDLQCHGNTEQFLPLPTTAFSTALQVYLLKRFTINFPSEIIPKSVFPSIVVMCTCILMWPKQTATEQRAGELLGFALSPEVFHLVKSTWLLKIWVDELYIPLSKCKGVNYSTKLLQNTLLFPTQRTNKDNK
jgi:hypothetical protein